MPKDRRSKDKDKDADSFIDAGGSAPGEEEDEQEDEIRTFTVRIPASIVDRIDEAKVMNESRNQWLIRAALEKLEGE